MIRSPLPGRKAPTAKPPTSRRSWPVIRAKVWPTTPSTRFARSLPATRHRRVSTCTSPGRPRSSPTSTTRVTKASSRSRRSLSACIFVMLLFVYRSIVTTILILLMVFIELGAARGIVALLADNNLIGLSTFAVQSACVAGHRSRDRLRDFPDRPLSGSPPSGRGSKTRATTQCFTVPPTSFWAQV